MTLLEYALKLVDDKLAVADGIEQRLAALEIEPELTAQERAELAAIRADYTDYRRRLVQQKLALVHEAAAYHAERYTPMRAH